MTAEQFEAYWESTYPLSVPLSHFLRVNYASRWFRIHSLPESQRYPHDDADWTILLNRQNALISDLLGERSKLLLITGEYDFVSSRTQKWRFSSHEALNSLVFEELNPIELGKLPIDPRTPDGYDAGDFYRPVVAEIDWYANKHDEILKAIASWEFSAFLLSIEAECIIAPYDGGVNIILKDTATRDYYKLKYKQWLSFTKGGL